MKKIISILFILSLSFSNVCYSQSGWFWQNPLPQGNVLYSVKFINSNTAFACGYSGIIMKTSNSGINWNILRTDSGYINTSICFHDLNTGWITSSGDLYGEPAYSSLLLKTTNSGMNWIIKYTFHGCYLECAEFTSIDTGYVLARGNPWGVIYKTTNGGENWSSVYGISGYHPKKSFFFNNSTGYVCGSIGIIKTTNGGLNWENQLNSSLNSIYFLDVSTGFAVGYRATPPWGGSQEIYKTTNSGINWFRLTGTGDRVLNDVFFINQNSGFACGGELLITTSNGGTNWLNITPIPGLNFNSIDFLGTGLLVGNKGIILKSSNNGLNWVDLFPSCRGNDGYGGRLRFYNSNIGFAAMGFNLLKTTNGGNNWFTLTTGVSNSLNDIYVCDSATVYCVGGVMGEPYSVIIKSTNGGQNWVQQNAGLSAPLYSVYFLNLNTGYCASPHGSVIKTTNGGNNWSSQPLSGTLKSICFVDSVIGFVTGYVNAFKTTNGGESWFSLPQQAVNLATSIYFINANTGYTTNYNMQIRKTTNGGFNWSIVTSGTDCYLHAINFLNSSTGFAVGNFGTILKTTNGGNNWNYLNSPTNNGLNSVYVIDSLTCYAAGSNQTILKSTNGGVPIGIEPSAVINPISFFLSQNYPNPFNPVTKIKYDIPPSKGARGMKTQLIIYDILGREIETLVNQSQKPGSYEVTWDGSGYASGVYFYRLITDEFAETKKMVLIK